MSAAFGSANPLVVRHTPLLSANEALCDLQNRRQAEGGRLADPRNEAAALPLQRGPARNAPVALLPVF